MYGLLGPNGAGKSTLMRTIAALQEPDEGSIFFDDINVLEEKYEIRKRLGYLPQEFGVYPNVTAEELLNHIGVLKGIENKSQRKKLILTLLEKTNLYEDKDKKLKTFSGGMKQRFGIAQALLADPKLLIVDEPTAGLDPEERNRFHNFLSEIGEDIIVILSTHIVSDVSQLCSSMAIIHEGNILLEDSPKNSIKNLEGKIWRKEIEKSQLKEYKDNFKIISKRLFAGNIIIHVLNDKAPDSSFKQVEPDLEDVYFSTINDNNEILT